MPQCGKLIDVNVCAPCIRSARKIIVYSRCLEQLNPSILDKILNDGAGLSACPEAEHINMLGFKLAGMIARCKNIEEVVVFTVDGSMHCIQLHYMVEEIVDKIGLKVKRRHLVFEKGEVCEIPPNVIKTARYLTKVKKLIERAQLPQGIPHSNR